MEAARAALKVIDWPEVDSSLTGMDAEEFRAAALVRKATGLAEIYGRLLVTLTSIEGAADRVAAAVEKKRHTIVGVGIGEDSLAAVAAREAFSIRVREILEEPIERRDP